MMLNTPKPLAQWQQRVCAEENLLKHRETHVDVRLVHKRPHLHLMRCFMTLSEYIWPHSEMQITSRYWKKEEKKCFSGRQAIVHPQIWIWIWTCLSEEEQQGLHTKGKVLRKQQRLTCSLQVSFASAFFFFCLWKSMTCLFIHDPTRGDSLFFSFLPFSDANDDRCVSPSLISLYFLNWCWVSNTHWGGMHDSDIRLRRVCVFGYYFISDVFLCFSCPPPHALNELQPHSADEPNWHFFLLSHLLHL